MLNALCTLHEKKYVEGTGEVFHDMFVCPVLWNKEWDGRAEGRSRALNIVDQDEITNKEDRHILSSFASADVSQCTQNEQLTATECVVYHLYDVLKQVLSKVMSPCLCYYYLGAYNYYTLVQTNISLLHFV